jgi:hypothetical protein
MNRDTCEHFTPVGMQCDACDLRVINPCSHPNLYLLALERTGWRRYVFGRWVYSSEPFRRDIQRKCAHVNTSLPIMPWEQWYPSSDKLPAASGEE